MGVKLHIGGAADRAGRILPQNVDIGCAPETSHGQAGVHRRFTAAVITAAEDKPVSIDKVAKRRHGAVTPDSPHNKQAPFLWGSFFSPRVNNCGAEIHRKRISFALMAWTLNRLENPRAG
ncbi:MAG: hypothetical protein R3C46_12930 [Hyphomonadaceae bacterium]